MEKITLKAYAVKYKLSMFNVVKLVKNGKVRSETVEENGKNVVYILEENEPELPMMTKRTPMEKEEKPEGLLTRVSALESEIATLRKEIEALKKLL